MNRTSSPRTPPPSKPVTLNKAGQLGADATRLDGKPQTLDKLNAAHSWPPTPDQRLAAPQGETLAAATGHEDGQAPAPQPLERSVPLQRDQPDISDFSFAKSFEPRHTDAADKVVFGHGDGITAEAPSIAIPLPSELELKEAHDAVAQDEAELKAQQKAIRLETRIATFLASMQTFIDRLEKKYGLAEGSMAPLRQLFAHAHQTCAQRLEKRTQQLEQASTTLAQHTQQAQYLSELARGRSRRTHTDAPVTTPQPAKAPTLEPSQELAELIGKLDAPDQAFVDSACKLAEQVIVGNPAVKPGERTSDAKELRTRWIQESKAETAVPPDPANGAIPSMEEDLFEISNEDIASRTEQQTPATNQAADAGPATLSFGELAAKAQSSLDAPPVDLTLAVAGVKGSGYVGAKPIEDTSGRKLASLPAALLRELKSTFTSIKA